MPIATTDPASILSALIRCPSVTPAEGGALDMLEELLAGLGFTCHRLPFGGEREDRPVIDNLYATIGEGRPHLMFAGHSDVVPPGDEAAWRSPPFGAKIEDGVMIGRGAVDMKGGIAAFIAAAARHLDGGRPAGKLSLLITGDEEGPALDGTIRVLEWAAARGERWDGCLVGEPTNPDALGDMIKIGRRGSHTARLTVRGVQGHVAYPHLAANPIRPLLDMLAALHVPLDAGTPNFQPSNLEVTTIDVGNPASNVIPARASATFNIRFNDRWNAASLVAEIDERLTTAAAAHDGFTRELVWNERVSDVFVTTDEHLSGLLAGSVEHVTGRRPVLSTTGGTSDARFIKDYCPVVEFGLVGQTMHQLDERVALTDLAGLADIYQDFLGRWFEGEN